MLALFPVCTHTQTNQILHFGLSMSAQVKPGNEATKCQQLYTKTSFNVELMISTWPAWVL